MTELRLVDQARSRSTILLPLVHPVPLDYRHAFLRGAGRGIGVLDGAITVTAPDVDALSGAPAGIGSVAGLPTLEARLAAVAAGSGSPAARAILSLAIAGLAQGAGAASGALSAILGEAGAPAGVGGAVGDVRLAALLSAVAAGVGAVSGSAAPSGALMGSLDGVGAMTGAVQASLQESASAGGLGAAAGSVQAALGESGVAIGVGTAAAATLAALAVLGSGQGVGAAAAAIQAVLSVAGITAGAGATSAAVTALLAEAETVAGVGTAAATVTLTSGGTNLLQAPNAFNNGTYWAGSVTVSANNIVGDPLGGSNATRLSWGGGGAHFLGQDTSTTAAGTYTAACHFKAETGATFAIIEIYTGGANGWVQWFDLSSGAVGSSSTFGSGVTVGSATITSEGNGWYLCTTAGTVPSGILSFAMGSSHADADATQSAGDTLLIYSADLR